jgi:hypothetical protein|tara:strand:+ start:300 stop:536 length:237 start_codon:yes stop_codon:yes gene_type:complete
MNDLSNDIRALDSMKIHLLHASQTSNIKERQIAIDTVWFLINQMKFEKQKIIERFEKEQMSYDQYANHMKNVGLNDVA